MRLAAKIKSSHLATAHLLVYNPLARMTREGWVQLPGENHMFEMTNSSWKSSCGMLAVGLDSSSRSTMIMLVIMVGGRAMDESALCDAAGETRKPSQASAWPDDRHFASHNLVWSHFAFPTLAPPLLLVLGRAWSCLVVLRSCRSLAIISQRKGQEVVSPRLPRDR